MTNRNRLIGPEIRIAQTGSKDGICEEEPALPVVRMLGCTGAAGEDSSSSGGETGVTVGRRTY